MKSVLISLALMAGLAVAVVGYLTLAPADKLTGDTFAARPVWVEQKWPFPMDQWGTGRAFECTAMDCGTVVRLYLRAKLGSCNCENGVADDADLDRMSDFDLIGSEVSPVGAGRPVTVGWMKGRSRAYLLTARNLKGKSAISVILNDRCDMIVATVITPQERTAAIELAVTEFLNSRIVLDWAEVALGI